MINDTYISPLVVEITLFKHNWKDNKLISILRRDTDLLSVPESKDVYIIAKDDMAKIIYHNFSDEVKQIRSTEPESLYLEVNSVYFLSNMIASYDKLKYFRINVSSQRNYTRLNKQAKIINFNHKIVYAKINLVEQLDEFELDSVRHLLEETEIIPKNRINRSPYVTININDLYSIFEAKEKSDGFFREYFVDAINILLGCISEKFELDNSTVMLIIED